MFEQAFKNIDAVLHREAGCTTELDYTEQTSWLLFLKYLDGLEQDLADQAALEGKKYSYILDKPWPSLRRTDGSGHRSTRRRRPLRRLCRQTTRGPRVGRRTSVPVKGRGGLGRRAIGALGR
jgi:hypothetical protein